MLERAAKERAMKILRMMETTNENGRAAAATMLLKLANAHNMNLAELVEAFGEKQELEPQTDWGDSDYGPETRHSVKRFWGIIGVVLLILLGLGLASATLLQEHDTPAGVASQFVLESV